MSRHTHIEDTEKWHKSEWYRVIGSEAYRCYGNDAPEVSARAAAEPVPDA